MELNGFQVTDVPGSDIAAAPKYFTVAEANAALPLVRRIVQDIVEQYQTVMDLHGKLQGQDLPEKESEELDAARRTATARLSDLATELSDIGCELKDWEAGLVDFPARFKDQDVYLCWQLGEQTVEYWHDSHTGFSGRVKIAEKGDL